MLQVETYKYALSPVLFVHFIHSSSILESVAGSRSQTFSLAGSNCLLPRFALPCCTTSYFWSWEVRMNCEGVSLGSTDAFLGQWVISKGGPVSPSQPCKEIKQIKSFPIDWTVTMRQVGERHPEQRWLSLAKEGVRLSGQYVGEARTQKRRCGLGECHPHSPYIQASLQFVD